MRRAFESAFQYLTGTDCLGHAHSLRADMVDTGSGVVYGSLTINSDAGLSIRDGA